MLKDQEVSVNSLVNGNMSIGDGYKYNKSSGLYTLTNLQTNQTFNKSTIGKYACANNNGVCQKIYKIKEVKESEAKENYSQNIEENVTVSYTSSSNKIVAESFHFDQDTGYFILENLSELKSYDSSDVGKYTCNSNSTSGQCTIMYKINSVTDTTVNNVDKYSRSANYNTITKADQYGSTSTSVLTSESGVYKTEDDDGESYYFRGKIDNNYVSFANNIWRIVRINEDGTIRIIKASNIGTSVFGSNALYSGSTIETYLNNWINTTDYDVGITESTFCNDVSGTGWGRLHTSSPNPTFACSSELLKLKVGLITADEAVYAGVVADSSSPSYLSGLVSHWVYTMTNSGGGRDSVNMMFVGLGYQYGNTANAEVYPVINLKADITAVGGDGTSSNPYLISFE